MDKISHIKTNMRITAWTDMIRERNESGQIISEWCTNNGINQKHFTIVKGRFANISVNMERTILMMPAG